MEKPSKLKPLLSSSSSSPSTLMLLFLISFTFVGATKVAAATDTLLPGQSLNGTETLLSRNGVFKLGCGPWPDPLCYMSIWFANTSSCYGGAVWKISTENPIDPSRSSLSLSQNGNLLLRAYYPIWSSESARNNTSVSPVAVLLDNGNFVVRDRGNSSVVLWQSFDYPTGTMLPGGRLGFDKVTGRNISLTSEEFTLEIDARRSRGFVIRRILDGSMYAGAFPDWMDLREDGNHSMTFGDAHIYAQLDLSGKVCVARTDHVYNNCSSVLWSAPESQCEFDSFCGPYGLCSKYYYCKCPDGFKYLPATTYLQNSGTCLREVSLNCESNISSNQNSSFSQIRYIYKFPDNPQSLGVGSTEECEAACLSNCSCTAYSYNTTCQLWHGELRNTVVYDEGLNGHRIYIRIASNKEIAKQQKFGHGVTVVLLGVVAALLVVGLIILCACRRKLFIARPLDAGGGLVVFSYAHIKRATKNFAKKLGEGGFGCVFKGTLQDSTVVAVKKLKDLGQGEKQFRAEVQTIGLIHHVNLVRLLGFCAEGRRRLLVYEYMANGSLSSHLFSKSSATLLNWELRYRIALGVARGLAYLHEECKDCIIHCDMKPDNVLLDALFRPKIADFGMAKLLGRDFSRALTTMRGTIGYLAPEWISGQPITQKSDVYSYGMMLLEIISGCRNTEKIKEGKYTYFPLYAGSKVNEGDVMCLLDYRLDGAANLEELNRACKVALWCIQDAEDHRPLIGQVVQLLEGVVEIGVPPIPRSLQNLMDVENDCIYSALDLECS